MKVLLVEDHPGLREPIEMELRDEGYLVDSCSDGLEAEYKMSNWSYDAVILDIMLPGLDGLNLLKKFRNAGNTTPVLMLTAQSGVKTKVASLNIGADDYLTKPFEFMELSARLRALIRRSATQFEDEVEVGDVSIHPRKRKVCLAGSEVDFTRQEYAVLMALVTRRGRAVSREFLCDFLSEQGDSASANLLDVIICKLRRKLGKDIIQTKRGVGYVVA